MTFSILILGVLLILVSFNVGESIFKKLKIQKKHLLILLFLTLILYFVPNVQINGITFTWIGFFMPLIFSVLAFIKAKKKKLYFKLFVSILISFTLGIIYNLITFDVYESAIFQPYLILGIMLGTIIMPLLHKPTLIYCSNFFGLIWAEVVFYISRYSIYGEYYLSVGSRKVFETLIVSFVSSLLVYYISRKIKVLSIKRKLKEKRLFNNG